MSKRVSHRADAGARLRGAAEGVARIRKRARPLVVLWTCFACGRDFRYDLERSAPDAAGDIPSKSGMSNGIAASPRQDAASDDNSGREQSALGLVASDASAGESLETSRGSEGSKPANTSFAEANISDWRSSERVLSMPSVVASDAGIAGQSRDASFGSVSFEPVDTSPVEADNSLVSSSSWTRSEPHGANSEAGGSELAVVSSNPSSTQPESSSAAVEPTVLHTVRPCRGAGSLELCEGVQVNGRCTALQGASTFACYRTDYRELVAGKRHTCVLYARDHAVNCWGSDDLAQVRDTPLINSVSNLQAGGVATCLLDSNGEPRCWGEGPLLQDIPSGPFTELSVGWDAACGRDSEGFYTCWGDDSDSKLSGRPDEPVVALAIGWQQACAVLEDGSIACWGSNDSGQASPPPGNDYKALSLASWHGCATRSDNTLICWGGVTTAPQGQTKVVSSRGLDTCAVMANDTVKCWGNGAARSVPSLLARNVAVGDGHACAILLDGQITCWGAAP